MEFYSAKPGNANPVEMRLWSYAIPLAKPIRVEGRELVQREGLVVGFKTPSGAEGWGEIAPLDGLFSEKLPEAQKNAKEVLTQLRRSFVLHDLQIMDFRSAFFLDDEFWKSVLPDFEKNPSVRSGFEMAFCSLVAAEQKIPLRLWLNAAAAKTSTKTSLLLEAGSGKFVEEGAGVHERGFRTIKIKIARTEARLEQEAIGEFTARYPEMRLRLDANRKLSEEEFQSWLEASTAWPVEYWEEPFRDASAFGRFEAPFAIDESLREITSATPKDDWEKKIDALPQTIEVWIVKPSRLGSLRALAFLSGLATERGKKLILSSSFESRLGLSFWAEVAGAFGTRTETCASGLGTLDYFSRDLCLPEIKGARAEFPGKRTLFTQDDFNRDLIRSVE